MTKFEQVGVSYQQSAPTKHAANRSFKISCNICCNRGLRIDCDRCAIAVANAVAIAAFDTLCPTVVETVTRGRENVR